MKSRTPTPDNASLRPEQARSTQWRCHRCGHLLGIVRGHRLHLRIGRRFDYTTALPAVCTCPDLRCRAANDIAAVDEDSSPSLARVG